MKAETCDTAAVACIDTTLGHVLKTLDLVDPPAVNVQAENLGGLDEVGAGRRLLPRVDATDEHGRRLGPRNVHVFRAVLKDEAQIKTRGEPIPMPPDFQRSAHVAGNVWACGKQASLAVFDVVLLQSPEPVRIERDECRIVQCERPAPVAARA